MELLAKKKGMFKFTENKRLEYYSVLQSVPLWEANIKYIESNIFKINIWYSTITKFYFVAS